MAAIGPANSDGPPGFRATDLLRIDFRNLWAFGTLADANPDLLSGSQNLDPDPPQRFYMHEDILIILAALDKPIPLVGVEPLHRGVHERPLGNNIRVIGVARRGWTILAGNCGAYVDFDDAKGLQSLWSSNSFANDRGAFVYCVVSSNLQSRMMNEYITGIVRQCNEPEAF